MPSTMAIDNMECVGGRDSYVQRMLSHQRKLAEVRPTVQLQAPKAAFAGGTRRTPRAPPKVATKHDEFTEVREAFRRIVTAKHGIANSNDGAQELSARISAARRASGKINYEATAHAARLRNQERRIRSARTLVERKKNKLDAEIYPSRLMRRTRRQGQIERGTEDRARRAAAQGGPYAASWQQPAMHCCTAAHPHTT